NGDTFLVSPDRAIADRERGGASALNGPRKLGSAHTRPAPRFPHDLHDQRLLAARFAETKLYDFHSALPSPGVTRATPESDRNAEGKSSDWDKVNPQSVPANRDSGPG